MNRPSRKKDKAPNSNLRAKVQHLTRALRPIKAPRLTKVQHQTRALHLTKAARARATVARVTRAAVLREVALLGEAHRVATHLVVEQATARTPQIKLQTLG
ncbi:hypothetical protein HMPREF0183_1936 [Brevibacterium mcbrellneri ATCC 49030]|uniref:Uncharacterized protein n=1 Tax=Brevibacterium mcbrellneri ATCC 49030 TaxID=585530 RepID=D4YPS6_9MICO|nr:hypothetical protein HMPREF0183_1936 [Brevibacterium mcbrellneri ATCC 49030]